ncbi:MULTISPECIES: type II toxin-antitoxin system VapC family toxin [unclassified Moraxella]|uniref:type II toxin-antitoxin system VapC family toxin n=1 Tax=unclassified Moraxella TaxID=2685852 RepID=UPI003AF49EA3
MNTLDTNVLVRFFVTFPDDDETTLQQQEIASQLILQPSFIPITIILELVWILDRVYKMTREEVGDCLQTLLRFKHFTIENIDIVKQACDYYLQGMDFADALHLLKSSQSQHFYTFDKKFINKSNQLGTVLLATNPNL